MPDWAIWVHQHWLGFGFSLQLLQGVSLHLGVFNCSWMQSRHDVQCGSSSCDLSTVDDCRRIVTRSF